MPEDSAVPGRIVTEPIREPENRREARRIEKLVEDTLAALEPVNRHVQDMWWKLMRSPEHLFVGGMEDEKIGPKPKLYYASSENEDVVSNRLAVAERRVQAVHDRLLTMLGEHLPAETIFARFDTDLEKSLAFVMMERIHEGKPAMVEVTWSQLPERRKAFTPKVDEHGLLYVPNAYVVPGTRFNEMYGWDSAFIVRGLLESGKFHLAKEVTDGMIYQVAHYGAILNGNRTYYYDTDKARSQPPLFTGKILGVYLNYDKISPPPQEDKLQWLERAAAAAATYHEFWTTPPHLDEMTQLSRYASDLGIPSNEVEHCEPDHYQKAIDALETMHAKYPPVTDEVLLTLPAQEREERYYLSRFHNPAGENGSRLTQQFYKGDRAMRESGFDPSERFGFFNADVMSYVPVCLNSLLVKHEEDMATIYKILRDEYQERGDTARAATFDEKVKTWQDTAKLRRNRMRLYLWDEGSVDRPPAFRDRFTNEDGIKKFGMPAFRDYNFATAFFPMWANVASYEQAADIMNNIYPKLIHFDEEGRMHGILTSDRQTGCQWDKPMIWAPLVVVATEAMERYGYRKQALEVASGFLRMVAEQYAVHGAVFEKYEGYHGTTHTGQYVDKGYDTNCRGFGWTNAAIVELQRAIVRIKQKMLGEEVTPSDIAEVPRPVRQPDALPAPEPRHEGQGMGK